MDESKFIEAVISEVHDSSVDSVFESLGEPPPGRARSKAEMELFAWFINLNESDKKMIKRVIQHSVHSSLFGMFVVLDGNRGLEDGIMEGEFHLTYKNTKGEYLLSKESDLHSEYQYQVYEKVFGKDS
ncbi:hypothetical protein [Psychromonas arctica]|uniref:hypothetical protein n=1 Tax=Psychromonas arctica TaxID=168275 RepID=UPI002FCF0F39